VVRAVRGIWADDDMVIVPFDGVATATDGQEYRNTYTWYMRMKNGRVVDVTAFFATRTFDAPVDARDAEAGGDVNGPR
jgi:ketosteroid isomerase-like protein